jgi:hypothetical protein
MVYAAAVAPITHDEILKKSGVGDSKQISEEKRTELFELICKDDNIGYVVHAFSPAFLSNAMLQTQKHSLNAISHNCAIDMIRKVIDDGFDVREVRFFEIFLQKKVHQFCGKDLYFSNLTSTNARRCLWTQLVIQSVINRDSSICFQPLKLRLQPKPMRHFRSLEPRASVPR